MLAARRWQELDALELAELRAVLTTLPEEAVAAEPFALVQVARLAEQEADLELAGRAARAGAALVGAGAPGREVAGELVAARAIVEPSEEVEREGGGDPR